MDKPRNTYPRSRAVPVTQPYGRPSVWGATMGSEWNMMEYFKTTRREWWEQVDRDLLEEIITTVAAWPRHSL